jgi:predicted double-glycine peptidase
MRTPLHALCHGLATLSLSAVGVGCSLTSPPTLSPRTTELDVPHVQQARSDACGAATVQSLAQYWNLDVPDDERARLEQRAAGQYGLCASDLRSSLEGAGMDVYVFRGTQDQSPTGLWRQLDDARPLIVAIASAEDRYHFVLLVGHDPVTGAVVLRDPLQGRLVLPADRFTACWERANRFTLLAVARDDAGRRLDVAELAALSDAQGRSGDLADLKAGHEFTDRDVKLVAGTAVIVIVIALLL